LLLIMTYLAILAHGGPVAGAEQWQEASADWGGSPGAIRVTVEVEAEQLSDRVRFTYSVRNLTEPLTGGTPAIVSLVIGVRGDSVRSELTAPPIEIESPPGWEAKVFPDDRAAPPTWRLEWSCSQRGWEHSLKYHIRAGSVLSGFRVSAPIGDSTYLTARYTVAVDGRHGVGATPPLGLSGKVKARRATRPHTP
jgi:hypothetical protein